jgi:hypothetical protein
VPSSGKKVVEDERWRTWNEETKKVEGAETKHTHKGQGYLFIFSF